MTAPEPPVDPAPAPQAPPDPVPESPPPTDMGPNQGGKLARACTPRFGGIGHSK